MVTFGHKIIFRRSTSDQVPVIDGGRISVSTHINGLVDPLVIVHSQDRRFTALGRHDLVTRPLLGWWCRGLGIQPILRKVETTEGITDRDFATTINQRSMLTVSNCISSGHSAVVFPEGTSHQDPILHGFKTGPFRTVFAASALAEHRNQPPPHIQPTGLHWRNHTKFRTDHFVEYLEPIPIPNPYTSSETQQLIDGVWVEPPENDVVEMRDRVFEILNEATPNSPDWETYRSWILMAHRRSSSPIQDLKKEVLQTRIMREAWRDGKLSDETMENAKKTSKILSDRQLDPRDINPDGSVIRDQTSIFKLISGLFMMLLSAPLFLVSTFPQAFLAWWMGDRTDEGIDARTTYHLLAAMFSIPIFWPISSLLVSSSVSIYLGLSITKAALFIVACFPLFYLTCLMMASGYDMMQDYARNRRRIRFVNDEDYITFRQSLSIVDKNLVDLI